ncbi:MAG: zinc ribbon domain-containing protein [Myxococcales bacterium]|nr:zinc ribbon domain-containing protein [Myxococcales bacterium]
MSNPSAKLVKTLSAVILPLSLIVVVALLTRLRDAGHPGLAMALFLVFSAVFIGSVVISALIRERRRSLESQSHSFGHSSWPSGDHSVVTLEHEVVPAKYALDTELAIAVAGNPTERMPIASAAAIKVCTTCSREFRTNLEVCPFDRAKLVPRGVAVPSPPASDRMDTRRRLKSCPKCRTEYDLDANFCPADGHALEVGDIDDARILYDGDMQCPECHEHFESDAGFCPDDGARLVPTAGAHSHAAFSAIPLTICPTCLEEYPVGTGQCPNDGGELLLLLGRTTGANPGRGAGEIGKVCPSCGDSYGDSAEYCRTDGEKLIQFN